MQYKNLIGEYGQSKLAEELGVPAAQVSHWVQGVRSVPVKYCQSIKERINGVTLQMLRPDDWQVYWPSEPADPAAANVLNTGDAIGYNNLNNEVSTGKATHV